MNRRTKIEARNGRIAEILFNQAKALELVNLVTLGHEMNV